MKHLLLTAAFAAGMLLLSGGCERRPSGVLSDDEMVDLMVDLKLTEGYADVSAQGSNTRRMELADAVLREHGVSRADFDATLAWYGRNLDSYQKLYEKVEKELEKRQKEYVADAVELSADDESNLWPYGHNAVIDSKAAADGIIFSVGGSDVKKGDVVRWFMRLQKLADGSALLGVDYEDGSASFITYPLAGHNRLEMKLQTDTMMQVKRVYGMVRLNSMQQMPLYVDSISLMLLPYKKEDFFQGASAQRYRLPATGPEIRRRQKAVEDSVKRAMEADNAPAVEAVEPQRQQNARSRKPASGSMSGAVLNRPGK